VQAGFNLMPVADALTTALHIHCNDPASLTALLDAGT
jgi:hypothetical protein